MNRITQVMIERLEEKGILPTLIPGLLRSIVIVLSDNPGISMGEINGKLQLMGWDNFEMDDHTFHLIIASLEAEGFIGSEYKSIQWIKDIYKKNF